jgi:cytochrome b561
MTSARSTVPGTPAQTTRAYTRYSRIAVVLHWLVAVLIVANVTLALSADWLPDDWVRPVIDTHKSIGITVLGLLILRALWRIAHPPPPLPAAYPGWERILAHGVHGLLYLLMALLPLSGWLHDSAWKDAATHPMHLYGLVTWPRIGFIERIEPVTRESLHTLFGTIHTLLGYALYALLALHVGGALKHQWFDREPELQRMWL